MAPSFPSSAMLCHLVNSNWLPGLAQSRVPPQLCSSSCHVTPACLAQCQQALYKPSLTVSRYFLLSKLGTVAF